MKHIKSINNYHKLVVRSASDNPYGITEQYTVQYDGRGYIVGERLDTDYSKTEAATSLYKAYQYDAIGRLLKSASGETQQEAWNNWDRLTQYTYDRVGNRLTMNDGSDSMSYTYNQFDQLQEVSKNNETQTTYEYDLRGNQTKESSKYFDLTIGGVTTTYYNTTDYTYNLRNQMTGTQISTPGADAQTGEVTYETFTASNVYNAQGQRVQKTEGEETTKYFYSGTALFYTTNGWGTLTTENILDLGGQIAASKRFQDPNEPEANPFANKYYFYNYDIRGSVTNIVGPDGKLVTGYGYDEFGNQSRSGDGSFLNEVTFTGSVSDASTGLQYMNARFYQPTTGRFISQDSYSGNAYDPWTQHLYSYCMNNPTNFIDPTGHSSKEIGNILNSIKKEISRLEGQLDGLNTALTKISPNAPASIIKEINNKATSVRRQISKLQNDLSQVSMHYYNALKKEKKNGVPKKNDDGSYDSPDDVALDFCLQYQGVSQSEDIEYGAIIFKNSNGTYRLSKTYIGDSGSVIAMGVDAIWYTWNPGMTNCNVFGTVHTHPKSYTTIRSRYPDETYCCAFSGAADSSLYINILGIEIGFADNILPGVRYLGAPNGCLYKSVDGGENTKLYANLPIAQSAANVPQIVYPNH